MLQEEPKNNKDFIYLGKTNFRNADRIFGIKRKDRRQHTYIIGKSGAGKSILIHNMIVQDIMNGDGMAIIDPHGELVESILDKIPENRVKDVVYLNPADPDFHVGFNVLEVPDPNYRHLIASGLMSIFTKIWAGVWSARMEYILNNAVLALLENSGSTLLGLTRILVDRGYRQKLVANIKDPVVKAFWVNEYEQWDPKFRNEAIAPIQNKVGQFLSSSIIRNIVGQTKSTINFFDIMNEKKILLVNVSKGRVGEDNSALLGAMFITKIQLASMERVRIEESEREDFYLYVDEFQNFATDSFASILSESRKYRLDLIIAHQYVGQLVTTASTKVRDAVFGNVGTMIVFRIGAADAEFLLNEFSPEITEEDMVSLPNYNIYLKLLVDGVSTRPFSATTLPPFNAPTTCAPKEVIIESSRRLYAKSKEFIEREINRWSGMSGPDVEEDKDFKEKNNQKAFDPKTAVAPKSGEGKYDAKCASCGKDSKVHFKPTDDKPAYCDDCFKKIKANKSEVTKSYESTIDTSDLASMGIEFENKKFVPKQNIFDPKRNKPIEEIHLKDLPESNFVKHVHDFKKPEKQKADMEGLKNALRDALNKSNKENEQ
ncbi:MAG: hypothetical protein EXS49_00675 [Candidatus Pacebacteria bacterium]|nr:hypothetical protein [Candidatus Paceibacterota bacterium]